MSLGRFITLWTHPDYTPERVSPDQIDAIEGQLRTCLPVDYRDSVVRWGLPRPTIALLDAIVDRALDLYDVSEFLDPAEIGAVTKQWRIFGLSDELVAFAKDCMGNLFCFPIDAQRAQSAPVFVFDHDSGAVKIVSRSFAEWIAEFCSIAPH